MKQSIFILLAVCLFSCKQQPASNTQVATNSTDNTQNAAGNCSYSEYTAQAVLWFQHSPEMRALYIQSYNVARMALANNIKHKLFKKKKNAVVVDLDETILDNSPNQGYLYLSNALYSDSTWNAWVQSAQAIALPGAAEFLDYAKQLKCEVFYVSNRKKDPLFDATLQNLKKLNLPCADSAHLLLKTPGDTTAAGGSTKELRRQKIENDLNCEILVLCGDQLADFAHTFDVLSDGTETQIKDLVDGNKEKFGTRFIILPNPMYGDWLSRIIAGKDKNTACSHLDSLRRGKARSWR
ncbi:5'-nucleotidase, lipoprotein e(P4) family [Chitinophagaceae bacterium MMS25-I14]